jgi:hypothetical protein
LPNLGQLLQEGGTPAWYKDAIFCATFPDPTELQLLVFQGTWNNTTKLTQQNGGLTNHHVHATN